MFAERDIRIDQDTGELEGGDNTVDSSETSPEVDDGEDTLLDDGQWYKGRARDEHNRRRKSWEQMRNQEDPIQARRHLILYTPSLALTM